MAAKLNLSEALNRLGIYDEYYSERGISEEELKRRRRKDLHLKHPDRGGDKDKFIYYIEAWDRVIQHAEEKAEQDKSKCPACNGFGNIEKPGGFVTTVKCKKCGGTGRLK